MVRSMERLVNNLLQINKNEKRDDFNTPTIYIGGSQLFLMVYVKISQVEDLSLAMRGYSLGTVLMVKEYFNFCKIR